MTRQELFKAINNADDKYIEKAYIPEQEAEKTVIIKGTQHSVLKAVLCSAACTAVILSAAFYFVWNNLKPESSALISGVVEHEPNTENTYEIETDAKTVEPEPNENHFFVDGVGIELQSENLPEVTVEHFFAFDNNSGKLTVFNAGDRLNDKYVITNVKAVFEKGSDGFNLKEQELKIENVNLLKCKQVLLNDKTADCILTVPLFAQLGMPALFKDDIGNMGNYMLQCEGAGDTEHYLLQCSAENFEGNAENCYNVYVRGLTITVNYADKSTTCFADGMSAVHEMQLAGETSIAGIIKDADGNIVEAVPSVT